MTESAKRNLVIILIVALGAFGAAGAVVAFFHSPAEAEFEEFSAVIGPKEELALKYEVLGDYERAESAWRSILQEARELSSANEGARDLVIKFSESKLYALRMQKGGGLERAREEAKRVLALKSEQADKRFLRVFEWILDSRGPGSRGVSDLYRDIDLRHHGHHYQVEE